MTVAQFGVISGKNSSVRSIFANILVSSGFQLINWLINNMALNLSEEYYSLILTDLSCIDVMRLDGFMSYSIKINFGARKVGVEAYPSAIALSTGLYTKPICI